MDLAEGVEGDIESFPSPDELWEMTFPTPKESDQQEIDDWAKRLFAVPFEDRGGTWQPRYYQQNAINAVLDAVAAKQQRLLLTLATGTGKTAIAFQIAWKLFQAKWTLRRDASRSPRILFLADRNILADQAFNAFNAFEEDALVRIKPDQIRKKGKVPKNGGVFFTIFQTFMSGPGESPYFGDYEPDFFDLIIIDECHRGGANDESTWRAIMEHFEPAVQLGLTATPKRDVNGDTYDYFGEPLYTYALKDGINDGFLTPFKVKEISSTIDSYVYTPDDKVVRGEIDPERKYQEKDFNRSIQIQQREEYRVKSFLAQINQNQKTLVFCSTQDHAAMVRDLINQHANSSNTNYCHRVTAEDGSLGEQHLRDFQDNEKSIPTVLTTSQKLSTGVDAPEVRNIVLLRPVNSMVEFKQIVGRGTRLFDGKDYFTLFDFVEAHKLFHDEEWDGEPLAPEPIEPRGPRGPCKTCMQSPCICAKEPEPPCYICGSSPCQCNDDEKPLVEVILSDGKVRQIDSMVKTSFWSPSGTPISAEEFVQQLFGDLPSFFSSEAELRKIWSKPSTRKKMLEELSEKGYTQEQLDDLRSLVRGEDSDLFDVLNYVAYHRNLVPRLDRAAHAKIQLHDYDPKQQAFLNFVLDQYVRDGVGELDDEKLPELLELRYKALADAKRELGDVGEIRNAFIEFQQHLYALQAA
jgi:type I restriction enzyme R subunit